MGEWKQRFVTGNYEFRSPDNYRTGSENKLVDTSFDQGLILPVLKEIPRHFSVPRGQNVCLKSDKKHNYTGTRLKGLQHGNDNSTTFELKPQAPGTKRVHQYKIF